ncbi:MAG: hypothetical protein ABIV13_05525 [Fimbriimonadales bacterium]
MKLSTKIAAFAAAGALGLGLVAMPPSAKASEEGRRNTAYSLGAATLYLGLKKKTVPAIIAGAGTAFAIKRLDDAIDDRHDRERAYNASGSSSSSTSSGNSVRRVASSSSGRTANASRSGMSKTQLANHPYVQELISSAYTKGSKFGQQNGYEQGMSDGYKKGFDAGAGVSGSAKPTGAPAGPSTSASSLFARVMEAH